MHDIKRMLAGQAESHKQYIALWPRCYMGCCCWCCLPAHRSNDENDDGGDNASTPNQNGRSVFLGSFYRTEC